MTESRESCAAIYCGVAPSEDDFDARDAFEVDAHSKGPGAFFYDPDHSAIWIRLPARPRCWSKFAIRPNKLPNGASWQWDGNEEQPTLSPSLHWVGTWHGWLRAGQLVSC